MVFSTLYYKNSRRCMKPTHLTPLFFTCLFITILLYSSHSVSNGSIQVRSFKLEAVENGYSVSVDSEIELNPTLEQALKKSVTLYFVAKFTLVEPRWYWFNHEVARIKTRVGLRYYTLTRQYHLSDRTSSKYFFTLKEALQAIQKVYNEPLRVKSELSDTKDYHAELRLWLDLTRMPKPFQVEALGSSAWNLTSERLQWRMKLPSPEYPFQFSYHP